MAKKKLETDAFSMDGDLDFNFNDDNFGNTLNQESKKKDRGVVGNVAKGVFTGIKDTAKSPSFIKSTIEKSLPRTYGEIASAAGDVTTEMGKLYDEQARALKPRMASIASRLDQLVPEESKLLKKLTKKMKDATGAESNTSYGNQENAEDQAVNTALGAIFEQQKLHKQIDDRRQVVKDSIEKQRFEGNNRVFNSMDRSLSIMAQYTTKVTQGYQRKMLELQLRGYIASREHYATSLRFFQTAQAQNEAIIKNTSLPEYAKITMSDRFRDKAKSGLVDKLYGEGSFIQRGMKRFGGQVREFMGGVQMGLDRLDFGLDQAGSAREQLESMNEMLREMGEPELTKAEMAGAAMGGMALQALTDKVTKKIRAKAEKNQKLKNTLAKGAKWVANPAAAIMNMRKSDKWQERTGDYDSVKGKGWRILDAILENFTDEGPYRNFKANGGMGELHEPAMRFDNRAHTSLVSVIPGHLAAIHREIRILRTGDEKTPLQTYDYQKNEFLSTKAMGDRIMGRLGKEAKSSSMAWSLEKASKNTIGDFQVSDDVEIEVKRFMMRLSRIPNMDYTTEAIKATHAYDGLSAMAKSIVDARLEKIDKSEDKEELSLDLTKEIRDIRDNMPSLSKSIDEHVKAGYGDILAKRGLLKKGEDGSYEADEEAYSKFLEEHAAIRSDVNVKEDIKETGPGKLLSTVKDRANGAINWAGKKGEMSGLPKPAGKWNPKDAFNGIKKTKLYDWMYKLGKGDRKPHSGPMAQDVRRNIGEEAAPDGKVIDLQSMNGALMASIQYLGDEFDKLKQDNAAKRLFEKLKGNIQTKFKGKGKDKLEHADDPLHGILKNTARLVQLNELAFGMIGGKAVPGLATGSIAGGIGAHPQLPGNPGDKFTKAADWLKGKWALGKQKFDETKQTVNKHLHEFQDLYLPGGGRPIIRAAKLKAGFYRDSKTGKPIFTMEDLLKAEGDITDNKGNVLLTLEEKAKGLVDKQGNQIKTFLMGSFDSLLGKAKAAKDKLSGMLSRTVNQHLPAGWNMVANFAKEGYDKISKNLNPPKDLYIPGRRRPIIRATKIEEGFYRDAATGKPIFTMDQLLKAKGNIVTEKGIVILTKEELAQGLIDNEGKKVTTTGVNLVNSVIGMGLYAKDQAKQGFNFLKEKFKEKREEAAKKRDELKAQAKGKIEELKPQAENYLEKAKSWVKGKKEKFSGLSLGGLGDLSGAMAQSMLFQKKTLDAIVDIRDILLGDGEEVKKRVKKDLLGAAKGAMAGLLGGNTTIINNGGEGGDGKEVAEAPLQVGGSSGGGGGIGGLLGKLRGGVDKAKELYAKGKEKAPGLKDRLMGSRAGQLAQKGWGKAGDKLSSLKQGGLGQKASGLFDKAKNSKFGGFLGKGFAKAKGFGGGLLGKGMALASGFLGGDQQEGQEQHEATSATDPNRAKQLGEHTVDWGGKKGKMLIPAGQRQAGDSDGDGVKDGSVEDEKKKQEDLKASRNKKGAEADLTVRYKSEKSILDTLIGGVGGLFSMMKSGLGGVFGLVGTLFSKLPGIGKILGGAAKGAFGIMNVASKGFGMAASGAGWLMKNGLKFGLRTAGRALLFGVTNVIPMVGSALLSTAGAAVGAIGSVLSSPVVLGAATLALAGYGIYKLYKYATRDNANDFEKLRLAQYGLSRSDTNDYRHMVYTLEAYLQDGKVGYDRGKAYIIDKNVKPEEIAEIFGVDKDDSKMGERVATWYKERFKSVFLTNLSALFAVDPKGKLDKVADLKPEQQIKYLEAASFESGPYGETTSPFKSVDDLAANKDEIAKGFEGLIQKVKEKIKKKDEKNQLPVKKPEDEQKKKDLAAEQQDGDKASELKKQVQDEDKKAKDETKSLVDSAFEGDDAPTQKDNKTPDEKPASAPGNIPMAPGAPLDGGGGMAFLKLGKGVDLQDVHPGTLKLLTGMAEEYGKQTGKTLQINDGFRDRAEQARLHQQNPDKAAPPGRSLHEFGLAIDMNSADADQLEKMGLMKKYGFTRPVGAEPWHMEPAGIQRNLNLAREDSNQRDLMVDASPFKGGGGYGTVQGATKFKRNQELAMSLLDIPGKPVEAKDGEKKDDTLTPTAVGSDGKSVATNGNMSGSFGKAANDNKAKTDDLTKKPTQEDSKSKDLPAPQQKNDQTQLAKNDAKANSNQASNTDGESKPTSGSGTGPEASGGTAGGDVKSIIAKNAKRAGGDPNTMIAFAAVESDLNPNAKAKGSTASGPFQFTKATWNEQLGKYASKYSLSPNASPFDPEAATLIATEYVKQNLKTIQKVKPSTGLTDAYLTHFLGPGGARQLLAAKPDAIAADVAPEAAKANRGIFYDGSGKARTVQELYDTLSKRLKDKASKAGVSVDAGSLGGGSATKGSQVDGLGSDSPTTVGSKDKTTLPMGSMGGGSGPAQPSPGQKATTSSPKMVSSSPDSGVFVNSGGSSPLARERRQQMGEGMAGPTGGGVETLLGKSVEVQQNQLDVLKQIAERLDPETLAKLLAAAVGAGSKGQASNESDAKQQDKRNMGRLNEAVPSSLNFKRQA